MLAVVPDSSPFIYLAALLRFGLLRTIYDRVLIPAVVWEAVAVQGGGRSEADLLRQAGADGWVSVEQAGGAVSGAMARLDGGEREAILPAKAKEALLIIDEARGRAAAEELGVRCTGTIGVLVEAKLRGLIPLLRPERERLRTRSNFRVTETVFQAALAKAQES